MPGFVGYTARYVGGVWVGNDDSKPMRRVTGGSLPADIWRQIMTEAHKGLPIAGLRGVRSRGVAQRRKSGADANRSPASSTRIDDPFLRRVLGALKRDG